MGVEEVMRVRDLQEMLKQWEEKNPVVVRELITISFYEDDDGEGKEEEVSLEPIESSELRTTNERNQTMLVLS